MLRFCLIIAILMYVISDDSADDILQHIASIYIAECTMTIVGEKMFYLDWI